MPKETKKLSGTDLIHGDGGGGADVTPSISLTTTFRTPHPDDNPTPVYEIDVRNPSRYVYSRYGTPVTTRVERILSKINNGYAITYASGLTASYAALLFYQPLRIAITGGYHGCYATIALYQKSKGVDVKIIDLDDEFQPGDLCWLETPLNPTGEARDIQHYADKIHEVGGKLLVDSTFAPPPLQYPFDFGADCILHSATKYFGGHSDLLGGVLVVKSLEEWKILFNDRTFMGNGMGSLEAWLLIRSLRTLHLRVPRQSQNATALAEWLNAIALTPKGQEYDGVPGGVIARVYHSSLQGQDARGFDPKKQMTGGWNATFSVILASPGDALRLPHALKFFVPATSLGGVESLIEHRFNTDPSADPKLVRLSIGVEDLEDLKSDFRQALSQVRKRESKL